MKIKKLKEWKDGDAGWLRDMDNECFPEDSSYANDDTYHWWVIYDGDKPVAYASLCVDIAGVAHFERCGVLESHRGKGLQTRLIKARLRWCKRQFSIAQIRTNTSVENHASINNLLRSGFRVYKATSYFLYMQRMNHSCSSTTSPA